VARAAPGSRTVEVSYLGAHGHLPLGVAPLLAAVPGVLMVALPGTARIIQLRLTARRHRHADTAHVVAAQSAPPPGQGTWTTPAQPVERPRPGRTLGAALGRGAATRRAL
jgi:hypothetical protein